LLKILIIGNEDLSIPFRAVGCEAKYVESPEEGKKILFESVKQEYGIIFIAESIAKDCMDLISQISETRALPIVTIIPDTLGKEKGIAEQRIQKIVKRAVGIELPE